jgi:hypothetical protein
VNLAKAKKVLSECHLKGGQDYSFWEDSSDDYLISRADEDMKRLKKVKTAKERERLSKRIIQLLIFVRMRTGE